MHFPLLLKIQSQKGKLNVHRNETFLKNYYDSQICIVKHEIKEIYKEKIWKTFDGYITTTCIN